MKPDLTVPFSNGAELLNVQFCGTSFEVGSMQKKSGASPLASGLGGSETALSRIGFIAVIIQLGFLSSIATAAQPLADKLADFNDRLAAATRAMDTAATLRLWDDNGTSILPEMSALKGKPAVRAFFDEAMAANPGGRMRSFELTCHPLVIEASIASEWCDEHQIIDFASDRPTFEGRGKLLLVLRYQHGMWRILAQMWAQGENTAPGIGTSK